MKTSYTLATIFTIFIYCNNFVHAYENKSLDNFDTTANIESFCKIQANNINFGVLNLPLTSQNTTSNMKILCSNNLPYTIDILFSKSSSGGTSTDEYFIKEPTRVGYANNYQITKNGKSFGGFECHDNGNFKLGINLLPFFNTNDIQYKTSTWYNDIYGICNKNELVRNVLLDKLNALSTERFMLGLNKKDNISYQIQLPYDSTKEWGKGVNSFSSIGNGTEQHLSFDIQIKPEKSSSLYVAEDFYQDSVIAEISY